MASSTRRVFVPTALHAELTEYTNLVRSLRTARTLDLTAHLIQHATQAKDKDRDKETDAETWTSWPLIDCPVPEWSFEDEVLQLGETILRQRAQATRVRGEDKVDYDRSDWESDSDLEGLSPTVANRLVLHTGAVLVHVLNLLADQRPSAPGSMQNRLWAMNWEDVISLLAVGGVVDPTIIARAEKRLERIYGPSTTKAMERLQLAASAKARFSKLACIQEDQLFAPPVLPRERRKDTKVHHLRARVKARRVIDTDTDMDT